MIFQGMGLVRVSDLSKNPGANAAGLASNRWSGFSVKFAASLMCFLFGQADSESGQDRQTTKSCLFPC